MYWIKFWLMNAFFADIHWSCIFTHIYTSAAQKDVSTGDIARNFRIGRVARFWDFCALIVSQRTRQGSHAWLPAKALPFPSSQNQALAWSRRERVLPSWPICTALCFRNAQFLSVLNSASPSKFFAKLQNPCIIGSQLSSVLWFFYRCLLSFHSRGARQSFRQGNPLIWMLRLAGGIAQSNTGTFVWCTIHTCKATLLLRQMPYPDRSVLVFELTPRQRQALVRRSLIELFLKRSILMPLRCILLFCSQTV